MVCADFRFPVADSLPALQTRSARSSRTFPGSSGLGAINCEALALNIQLGGQFCFNTQVLIAKDDKARNAICKENLSNNPNKPEQVGAKPCFTFWRWLKLGANWQEVQKPAAFVFICEAKCKAHSALFTCLGDFWQVNTCSWCKSSVRGQIIEKQLQ